MPKSDLLPNLDGYATVAERVELFYQRFPAGRITTDLVSRADGVITFRASVFRDGAETGPAATGWASEREGDGDINTVACLENTETSAVGRALANLGFTASNKRPSREEMQKAERARRNLSVTATPAIPSIALQRTADMTLDIVRLLDHCTRQGFPPVRANTLRTRLTAEPALPADKLRKLETALRFWLRRRAL